jgi:hypothetical protein
MDIKDWFLSSWEFDRLEHVIRCAEEYKAKGAKIRVCLHWIQEGDELSNFSFDFLR